MAGNKDVNKLEKFVHRKSTEEGSLQTRTRTEKELVNMWPILEYISLNPEISFEKE